MSEEKSNVVRLAKKGDPDVLLDFHHEVEETGDKMNVTVTKQGIESGLAIGPLSMNLSGSWQELMDMFCAWILKGDKDGSKEKR